MWHAGRKTNEIWNGKNTARLCTFIPDVKPKLSGMYLPRPFWVRLYVLRTGVGLFSLT